MGWPAFLALVFFSSTATRRSGWPSSARRPGPSRSGSIRPQLRRRHRARQMEALAAVGLRGAQVFQLAGRLDPLGDDLEPDVVREAIIAADHASLVSAGTPARKESCRS